MGMQSDLGLGRNLCLFRKRSWSLYLKANRGFFIDYPNLWRSIVRDSYEHNHYKLEKIHPILGVNCCYSFVYVIPGNGGTDD